jgi:hypothetical protein
MRLSESNYSDLGLTLLSLDCASDIDYWEVTT